MLDKFNNVITRPKNDIGYCNICDSYEKLTDDHIPPKGSTKITQVKMLSIHDALGVTEEEAKGRRSQNGVKFRTLCKKCNNEWLGLKSIVFGMIIAYTEFNSFIVSISHGEVSLFLTAFSQ